MGMKCLNSSALSKICSNAVVTFGVFDGVHQQHQNLLNHLVQQAKKLNLPSVVIILESSSTKLTSLREKLSVFKHFGIDYVYYHRQTQEKATPNFFENLKCNHLLIDKSEIAKPLLQQLINSTPTAIQYFNQTPGSTTLIAQLVSEGKLDEVKPLLGRSFSLCGRVIHGNKMGRKWGIPTANLGMRQRKLPLTGVFCVEVLRQNGQPLKGVANLGRRPTVDGLRNVLEVHLLDFNENLYGEILEVSFLHKLRDEAKFDSIDALIAQIHKDVAEAINYHFHS